MQTAAKAAVNQATFAWAPPLIGLTAVAWLAWETLPISFVRHLAVVVVASFVYVFIALATAYLVTSFVYWITPVLPELNTARVTRETAAISVLFPPLVILSFQRSAWALVLTIAALAGTATLMWWLHESAAELARISELSSAERPMLVSPGPAMFQIARPPALLKELAPFIAAAFLTQAAVLAYVLQERFMMALCLGLATLVFSWHASTRGVAKRRSSTNTGKWKLLLSTTLALALTLAGMVRWFLLIHPQLANSLLNRVVQLVLLERDDRPRRPSTAAIPHPVPDQQGFGTGGIFSGVILWDAEPKAIMLAPPLPQLFPEMFTNKPLGIEFSGYYSFFKPPLRQAPLSSTRIKGDPVKIGLRSSDTFPLLMEAHQDFGNLVNLDCCSGIELVVRSTDPHPEAIRFEMLLSDAGLPSAPPISLGEARLANTVRQPGGLGQTLSFTVPAAAGLQRFNQIIIRYHLAGGHEGSSARVNVDRFIFLPRAR